MKKGKVERGIHCCLQIRGKHVCGGGMTVSDQATQSSDRP